MLLFDFFYLILNFILYLNPPLKSCYIFFFSLKGGIESFIYKHNHNKCILIVIVIIRFRNKKINHILLNFLIHCMCDSAHLKKKIVTTIGRDFNPNSQNK